MLKLSVGSCRAPAGQDILVPKQEAPELALGFLWVEKEEMADKLVSLNKHRRHPKERHRPGEPGRQEENPNLVPCARCRKKILMTSTRCPECGVYFQGQALEFTHPSEQRREAKGAKGWIVWVALLSLLAFLAVSLR